MLERHHLRVLLKVHQLGSLTEAANKLHLTQSALSHTIKKLETHLQTPLLKKAGRGVVLTDAGQAVVQLAERILPQFDNTEQIVQRIAQGHQGMLRIGMECHPCYQWLLNVIEPFLLQHPHVDVDVIQAFKFGGLQALHDDEIDILLTPDPVALPTVTYHPVFHYEHMLAVADRHSLADAQEITPKDLRHQTLITYPVEPSRLDVFSQFLLPHNVKVKQHKVMETTEIIMQMVAAGRGVTALPQWLIEDYAKQLPIRAKRFGKNGIAKTLSMGLRAHRTRPDYLQSFIALARKIGGLS